MAGIIWPGLFCVRQTVRLVRRLQHQFTTSRLDQAESRTPELPIINGRGMGVGREAGGPSPFWILKCLAKKVVFLVLRGKNQISPLLAPLENILPTPMGKGGGKWVRVELQTCQKRTHLSLDHPCNNTVHSRIWRLLSNCAWERCHLLRQFGRHDDWLTLLFW